MSAEAAAKNAPPREELADSAEEEEALSSSSSSPSSSSPFPSLPPRPPPPPLPPPPQSQRATATRLLSGSVIFRTNGSAPTVVEGDEIEAAFPSCSFSGSSSFFLPSTAALELFAQALAASLFLIPLGPNSKIGSSCATLASSLSSTRVLSGCCCC